MRNINRKSISMFCVVFLCLAILTGVIVSTSYMRSSEKETIDYVELLNNETDEVLSHMVLPLSSSINSGNSIFNSTWYKHYQNIAGIYDGEFNALKRNDIYMELQRLAASQQLVENFLVVMPERGYIASSAGGWFTLRMYEQVYNTIGVDSSAGYTVAPTITVNDPEYFTIVIPDPTVRKYKNVIVLLMRKDDFRKELDRHMEDHVLWVQAEVEGQLLIDTSENAPEDCIVMTRSDSGTKLKLTIGYQSYESAIGRESRMIYILMMAIALVVSALVSLFITVLFIRPINQMILHFGGQHQDLEDPYRFIYEYVDTFAKNKELLSKENSMLQESRKRLLSMLRNEIVSNVLTSEEPDFQEDYIQSSFPWLSQSGHFVIAACQNGSLGVSNRMAAADFCEDCENSCFAVIGQENWFIYRFSDVQQLERGRAQLAENMKTMPHVISEWFEEPAQLHTVYLRMRELLKDQIERWMHLPILTQSKMIALVRTNKREELCQMIVEVSESHSLDSVFWLLSRLAWEYELEQEPSMERYRIAQELGGHKEVLALLQEYAVALCTYTAGRKAVNTDNSSEIIRYIEENFKDPNLSVNLLADQFGMHRTLISKMVKAVTGETFSDYLIGLRMEEAKKLLQQGVRPVSAVGEQVGIPNYSTFKRSFSKLFGESPKEWSENNM